MPESALNKDRHKFGVYRAFTGMAHFSSGLSELGEKR